MNDRINCKTQAECDAALEAKNIPVLVGDGHFMIRGTQYVVARGSSHVEASPQVAIHQHSPYSKVTGGVVIVVKLPKTPVEWCEFYGVKVEDNHAILFKGVNDNFQSPRGGNYKPGTMPEAADRDDAAFAGAECGGGLHFSPHPLMTLEYNSNADKVRGLAPSS